MSNFIIEQMKDGWMNFTTSCFVIITYYFDMLVYMIRAKARMVLGFMISTCERKMKEIKLTAIQSEILMSLLYLLMRLESQIWIRVFFSFTPFMSIYCNSYKYIVFFVPFSFFVILTTFITILKFFILDNIIAAIDSITQLV